MQPTHQYDILGSFFLPGLEFTFRENKTSHPLRACYYVKALGCCQAFADALTFYSFSRIIASKCHGPHTIWDSTPRLALVM